MYTIDHRLARALQECRLGEVEGQSFFRQKDRPAKLRAQSWTAKWLHARLFDLGWMLVELGTRLEQAQPLAAHSGQEQR